MHCSQRTAVFTAALIHLLGSLSVAQTPRQAALDSLNRSLSRISARLDSLEAGLCPSGAALDLPGPTGADPKADSLAQALRELNGRVESFRATRCKTTPDSARTPAPPDSAVDDLAALRAAAAAAAEGEPARPDSAPAVAARPRSLAALNPEISVTGDIRVVAQEGIQRDNFVPREFEFAFQSALDPYSSTKIFVTFEEDEVAVEEGYVYWTGLPGRIRADVGKFRQQVGDLNRWHLHALPESEYPLIYRSFLSPEGLAGIGVSLYSSLPVSLGGGTHEVWLQGTVAESDPLLDGGRQPTVLGRLQNFWQVTRSTFVQVGVTGVAGRNRDTDLSSNLIGLDFRTTYRPPSEGTRRELTFRVEGYRIHASQLGTTTNRYGGFADLQLRTGRRWILGTRYDYVEAPRGGFGNEWRLTPSLTWWQSEFVYLRLEGEHRDDDNGSSNQLLVQAVWAMGPHKHETY